MTPPSMHWEACMQQAQQGCTQAQHTLLSALAPRLRAYFRHQGHPADVAEDLVQETLWSIHDKRALWDQDRPLLAWVYAIARHRQIDHWRRQGRRGVQVSLDDCPELLADTCEEDATPRRDLDRLLATLPDKQRRAIELVKLQEHTLKEAADVTGWSESDLKVSIHRGLKALMRLAMPPVERDT